MDEKQRSVLTALLKETRDKLVQNERGYERELDRLKESASGRFPGYLPVAERNVIQYSGRVAVLKNRVEVLESLLNN